MRWLSASGPRHSCPHASCQAAAQPLGPPLPSACSRRPEPHAGGAESAARRPARLPAAAAVLTEAWQPGARGHAASASAHILTCQCGRTLLHCTVPRRQATGLLLLLRHAALILPDSPHLCKTPPRHLCYMVENIQKQHGATLNPGHTRLAAARSRHGELRAGQVPAVVEFVAAHSLARKRLIVGRGIQRRVPHSTGGRAAG